MVMRSFNDNIAIVSINKYATYALHKLPIDGADSQLKSDINAFSYTFAGPWSEKTPLYSPYFALFLYRFFFFCKSYETFFVSTKIL